tara:strand:- start:41037 stop:42413 length:1377 start_codon:yes stop_codon:yes gene_type:complete
VTNSITISSIQERMAEGVPKGRVDETTVRRLWWAALDTLQDEILMNIDLIGGIWLASPLPALYEPRLLDALKGWVWAPDQLENLQFQSFGLLPPSKARSIQKQTNLSSANFNRFPLRKEDGNDPLLIIITPEIQLALALHGELGERNLLMRSDHETLHDVLTMLGSRLKEEDPSQAGELCKALENLGPLSSNNNVQNEFWPLVSERLAGVAPSLNIQTLPDRKNSGEVSNEINGEISLLEAITHEVRTPLATIRTLIRSLLRRSDISEVITNRLKQIDTECTEQIDRFGLIFKAAELERNQSKNSGLARTDLGNMLHAMYPVWSKQLERRGLILKLDIASDLPQVLSDPEQLELMLGGLIDRNSRGLKSGGSLVLELTPAGHRLKLQIFSDLQNNQIHKTSRKEFNSALGTVLSWNPDTGSLQLSQGATQKLLASLGGRLANRRDSGLTVFFPVAEAK